MKKTTSNIEKTWSIVLGFLIAATPALATPLDNMIVGLRDSGFGLVLLWLLTLAVVFGALTHAKMPDSIAVRGVISIVASFLVLMAAAGTQIALFMSTLTSYGMVVAFTVIIALILLELAGAKMAGKHIFEMHPTFFGLMLVLIVIFLFIAAGGLSLFSLQIEVTSPIVGLIIFLSIIVGTVWAITKDG